MNERRGGGALSTVVSASNLANNNDCSAGRLPSPSTWLAGQDGHVTLNGNEVMADLCAVDSLPSALEAARLMSVSATSETDTAGCSSQVHSYVPLVSDADLAAAMRLITVSSSSDDSDDERLDLSHASSRQSGRLAAAAVAAADLASDDDDELGSSCSADSFQLSSPSDTLPKRSATDGGGALDAVAEESVVGVGSESDSGRGDSTGSRPPHSHSLSATARSSIHDELAQLDTALPQLDFARLERQLKSAAVEREQSQRRMMSEEVRRRLAADEDESPTPPPPTRRPPRSNLAHRLQSAMNLQVCYMNDTMTAGEDEQQMDCAADVDCAVSKSRSTPECLSHQQSGWRRGASSVGGTSSKRASELRLMDSAPTTFGEQKNKLETEARVMFAKAKKAAALQLEVEKRSDTSRNPIEDMVGVALCRKLSRMQLSRMNLTQLQLILNDMHGKVEGLNEQLVKYLIERDALHMEQDSMLVDIEDTMQHQRLDTPKLPAFLVQTTAPSDSPSPRRFRIFKR